MTPDTRRKRRRGHARNPEIDPDEIFLDASNAPAFDQERLEGRLERPLERSTFVFVAIMLAALFGILAVRAWNLEIVQGDAYAEQSARNSLSVTTLFAPRGVITDYRGVLLAENVSDKDGSMARSYPLPALGQIIGYVSYPKKDANGNYYTKSETGVAGLEAEYDRLLSGENGQILTETDAVGTVRSAGTIIPAKAGGTLKLSIDADLERHFTKAIADTVENERFIAGAGVIMDVRTGAVRAIVSYPTYDPNIMSAGSPADTIAAYNRDPGHPFLDHAVQGVYTPGSIVKPLVASGALTDTIITANTVIDDAGSISLPDPYHPGKQFIYKGWKALGALDVERAIAWSSDVFFYTVGGGFGSQKGLGIDRLDYWYRQFGLGTTTGIDLPGEAAGLIPSPSWKQSVFNEPWYLGDTYFTAIGQYSVQVTPIQMARATAAIASGGTLCTPNLIADALPACTAVPVDPAALATVRSGMRQGVTSALATAINLPYLSVAAKTGTAQTGTRNQYDNSWVIGFFPYDHPQYAFSVVLERGPEGAGEQAVNVMQQLFVSLHDDGSPYTGNASTSSTMKTSIN